MNIDKLVDILREASQKYYSGKPSMSDAEFDALREELETRAPDHPFLSEIGAPTQDTPWPIVKHSREIGSLNKIKHDEKNEFLRWAESKGDLILSEKLDGITIVATYKNGKLLHAVTRGNGYEGEDITPNFIRMKNAPEKLDFSGELRGEIILNISTYEKYFKPLGYKNPRNAAAGKARDTKDDEDMVRHLSVLWFQAVSKNLSTKLQEFKLINSLGLRHVTYARFFEDMGRTPEDLWERFEEYDRSRLDYQIDGLVVESNDLSLHSRLGSVSGRPKASVALKFESEGGITTIRGIDWQIGLTGRICPVAIIDPIDLAGATISRVTLNNFDYIKQLDVAIGDEVVVIRSNDVIPLIVRVTSRQHREYVCPKCDKDRSDDKCTATA